MCLIIDLISQITNILLLDPEHAATAARQLGTAAIGGAILKNISADGTRE